MHCKCSWLVPVNLNIELISLSARLSPIWWNGVTPATRGQPSSLINSMSDWLPLKIKQFLTYRWYEVVRLLGEEVFSSCWLDTISAWSRYASPWYSLVILWPCASMNLKLNFSCLFLCKFIKVFLISLLILWLTCWKNLCFHTLSQSFCHRTAREPCAVWPPGKWIVPRCLWLCERRNWCPGWCWACRW